MPEEDKSVELLKKLATDDDLRTQLESDPVRVLKDHGIDVAEGDLPPKICLPEKEELAKNLDKYTDKLSIVRADPHMPEHNFLIS